MLGLSSNTNPIIPKARCFWCGKESVFTVEIRPNEPNIPWNEKLELICRDCYFKDKK